MNTFIFFKPHISDLPHCNLAHLLLPPEYLVFRLLTCCQTHRPKQTDRSGIVTVAFISPSLISHPTSSLFRPAETSNLTKKSAVD